MTWLRCPVPRPWATHRLVCFPHAGGSAVAYRDWATSPAVEIHAVQYPGRADRIAEPLATDAVRTARIIAAQLAPLGDRPLALFGHSMGGLIAFETARALTAQGAPPVHLFVSGALAPDRLDARENISSRDDAGLVEALVALGGTDAAALQDPDLRELVLPYVRGDFQLLANYRHTPGPPLPVPVTALLGEADPHVSVDQAARWAAHTAAPFELRVLPGDHFYLVPHRDDVLTEIFKALNVPC